MTFPFKAVLFDWAYTLVDLAGEDPKSAFGKVFAFLQEKKFSLPEFEAMYRALDEDFRIKISASRQTDREACFENVLDSHLARNNIELDGIISLQEVLEIYYKDIYSSRKVFSDVIPTLRALKDANVRMGIVSNTTNPGFMKDYEKNILGLDPYFEFSVYSSELTWRKPHAKIFQEAIRCLGLYVGDILFVGDDLRMDVAGAQSVGMRAVWLNRNNDPQVDGIIPDYALNRFSDLLQISSTVK